MPGGGDSTSSRFKPANSSFIRKTHLFLFVVVLCIVSYLIGAYQQRPRFNYLSTTTTKPIIIPTAQCNQKATTLDFQSHHNATHISATLTSRTFPQCSANYTEYTPCEDPTRSLRYKRSRMIYRERHCPENGEELRCRVPPPYGYRNPFPWPASRNVAWYANVPHRELTVEKAVQNWIRYNGDRFIFPGGGTMFPNGADAYIDDIGKLINLKDGSIRTALDTGCGVASWGAYLLSRDILTMSIAPRDTHEAQVQFALERGVPALIGVLASKRLPFPSRAFDMAHCSRCLIPWPEYDGIFLNEVDRVLRPGGYWILSGPPINWKKYWKGWQRTKEDLNEEQTKIENLAKSLCWNKLVEKDDIAIWQKPKNHLDCKANRKLTQDRPFCNAQNDPDKAWYTDLQACLSPVPEVSNKEETSGRVLDNWPGRLKSIPPRIYLGTIEGVTPEAYSNDNELWKKRVSYYKTVNNQLGKSGRYRNLLDMNAYLGGFAAALIEDPVWVMNVVPVQAEVNTLGAIYERGLIGTYHDWCEAMSTYPRTYDLIHADSVFSLYSDRCELEDILLEMDRILRPEGTIIIRDDVDILLKVKSIVNGLDWDSLIVDHEDGPLEREKLLFVVKKYWTAPASS
ncbi:probable methyltransferase PMT16 [Gastrolobium bilobum]|uniref:probable methyltransferase PMT16 n=1 Tax=Gastrolobium bilobum TaxID=150636 RepID=UPI002AB186B6|nr:probable methyltransferase PMT16 [Gastrolobium bilobum]